ncbi:aminotransferase class I/II-fold pyridoxal phosphate-dependent enzyme [Mycetocola reblochoni]|uniref:Aromatic amino acid aminotransferase n=2 Tax=Mycetocola reblochoni TaxID=331618 RepID=A0A1R4JMN2_9MICO|nr:aminotransferase class I/II-fold pyridoxal phosphate-dependent enzyme [Mycetocola reblochoni]SJN33194.1 Biosynthetic Aromatic amino acid aminotransferase beta [Mycetocola reblochoni REB411]
MRLRPEIAGLPAYRQGRPAASDALKLSSNENPFPPLPGVVEAAVGDGAINRYPDATAARLRAALAARFDVDVDEVHVGAGSVSLIAQLLLAVAGAGDEVVYPWRSFEAYPSLVTVTGATSVQVPLTADHRHDLDAMADAIGDRTRAVIVCSPNNPTGSIVTETELRSFLDRVPESVLVILDEAYREFVVDPSIADGASIVREHPNVVLLRTFSKAYGLAGLRVGYAIGDRALLDAARSTAIPLAVTGLAENAALESLARDDEMLERVSVLVGRRSEQLDAVRAAGLRVPEPHGNFLWLDAGEQTGAVAGVLERHGIIGRAFPGSGVRISIGEQEATARLTAAAAEIVALLEPGHPLLGGPSRKG